MGFHVGDTGAPYLSHNQRIHLLGQCTDLNAICWTMGKIRANLVTTEVNTPTEEESIHRSEGFTYSQPLPTLVDTTLLHARHYRRPPSSQGSATVPFP
jgi:hypothetical protein